MLSPYQAMGNNPVSSMDPGGMIYTDISTLYTDNRTMSPVHLSPGTIAFLGLSWGGLPDGLVPPPNWSYGTFFDMSAEMNTGRFYMEGMKRLYEVIQQRHDEKEKEQRAQEIFRAIVAFYDEYGNKNKKGRNQEADNMPMWMNDKENPVTKLNINGFSIQYQLMPVLMYPNDPFHSINSGIRMQIIYNGSLKGYRNINWMQMYQTNGEGIDNTGGKYVQDGYNKPFYYDWDPISGNAWHRSNGLMLEDAPSRDASITNYYWLATSSLVGTDQNGVFHIIGTFIWGYYKVGNMTYLIPPIYMADPLDIQKENVINAHKN